MGLSASLARRAVAGAHVLLVESPGAWRVRVAAEQALRRHGWREAVSPADADVLLTCGTPGPGLAEAIDRVWNQLPGPRARTAAATPDAAGAALESAAVMLLDEQAQGEDARNRATEPQTRPADEAGEDDMSGPGGIALAEGGPDRDGLGMDVLHLPLGPVLPHWPPGLVLRCALQGDVVTAAKVQLLDAEQGGPTVEPVDAARRYDAAASLVALAGWHVMAERLRQLRDRLLAGNVPHDDLDRVRARVARSRTLRWSLRDLGRSGDTDVHDRLLRLLAAEDPAAGDRADVATLPAAVEGLDVAATRLVVASLAPLPIVPAPAVTGAGRG